MASYYLGPECPPPFSALSEARADDVMRRLMSHRCSRVDDDDDDDGEDRANTFDPRYMNHLQSLLQRYLDIDVTDRICYIGFDHQLVKIIQEMNFLKHEIVVLHPGRIVCGKGKDDEPTNETEIGIDEHFAAKETKLSCFDKIIIHDSLIYIRTQLETLANISRSLTKKGKMLILHRSHDTNTLPIFKRAKERMQLMDKSHVEIIQDLQKCGMQLTWNMEFLPCKMKKSDWLSCISNKQPPHLNLCSLFEIREGLRDLLEGIFKYENGILEFQDQLVFIEVSHRTGPMKILKEKSDTIKSQGLGLQYELLVTPEVHSFIRFLNIPKLPLK